MNYFRTAILLAGLTALFMGVGFLIGGQTGAVIALLVAAAMNLFSYWNADKLVLSMNGAHEIDEATAPELFQMVRQLAGHAGLPMPRVYIMDNPQPNAFATGRNPQNAAVAVTTGLMQTLNRDEVAGVVAHELAHIKNHDTLIMTITATIAGAISMLAQFGLFFGGHRDNNNGLGMIGTLAMVILAPLAAMIVQMAISRTREYAADNLGGRIAGQPMALASALAQDFQRRASHRERCRRAQSGDRAHVHHQSAVRPPDGQSVLDPPGGGEPHRGAAASCARDGPGRRLQQTPVGAPGDRHCYRRRPMGRPARSVELSGHHRSRLELKPPNRRAPKRRPFQFPMPSIRVMGTPWLVRATQPQTDVPGLAARRIAADILDGVLRRRLPLDDQLDGAARIPTSRPWSDRDRALVRALVAMALRRLGTLRLLIARLAQKGLPADAPRVETALLIGATQILWMEVPDHAAVDLSVRLAQADRHALHYAGLVNAVLRRLTREGAALLADIDGPALDLPEWLRARWLRHYGDETARAIAQALAHEPALDSRVKVDPGLGPRRSAAGCCRPAPFG